jgi:hypothetical protein
MLKDHPPTEVSDITSRIVSFPGPSGMQVVGYIDEGAEDCTTCLESRIHLIGNEVGYGEWGDSLHFKKRKAE